MNIANFIKYNKLIYRLYYHVVGAGIKCLRFFVKPDDHLILFNSFAGRKYDDSPKEIYLRMKNDPRFNGYRLVWAFHKPQNYDIPDKIKTDCLGYFKMALSARVWITNSSVERGLNFKRKSIFYLNTWHGTPLKLMGSDISADNESFGKKVSGKVSSFDAFCSQGRYESDIFSRTFNIPRERILECGLPRNDILSNYTVEDRTAIRKQLGISKEKKVILYCPTFREYEKDENNGCVLIPPMNLERWKKNLGDEYVLLFRAHYEVAKVMEIQENEFVRNMTDYPALNDLYIAADVLISDYSSVFFDYSITGKPMLHFSYDYDKYSSKRGMYFDIREHISGGATEDQVIEILRRLNVGAEQMKTVEFRDKFINFYGNAAKAAVDCVAKELGI